LTAQSVTTSDDACKSSAPAHRACQSAGCMGDDARRTDGTPEAHRYSRRWTAATTETRSGGDCSTKMMTNRMRSCRNSSLSYPRTRRTTSTCLRNLIGCFPHRHRSRSSNSLCSTCTTEHRRTPARRATPRTRVESPQGASSS
jgi:hypothetical protein